uniref:Polyhomeotic homolog 1 n=1 Tax=Nothobranchius furzeri TaxID=105023 RepID=A0A8C6KE72_NOTFU
MDPSEEQNTGNANGNTQTGGSSRAPQIANMSLYERQAVQALQALQRQPNAAQYFQQLMLQQQINNAQLNTLAAVQQATLAASRQSNTASNSMSQAPTTVNLSSTSAGGTMTTPRPHGPVTSAATTALNQSVLLGGNSPGQGQMYLRVNRSLRAPLASQFIFMPGGTAATVAAVAQTQPQQQQQQEAAATAASGHSDGDQVQNLTLDCAAALKAATAKSEISERKDAASFPLSQQQQQTFPPTAQQQQVQPQQLQQMAKASFNQQAASSSMTLKPGNQAVMTVTPSATVAPSSSPSPALPLPQLLLSSSAAPVFLVPTSNVTTSTQGYPIGPVAPKSNINAQTLVVQPLQQAGTNVEKGPVPIQPKTAQGHRLPVQLSTRNPPPILPAPPSNAAAGHNPPHIPVQLVGARQGLAGNAQAVALSPARSGSVQEVPSGGSSVLNNIAVVRSECGTQSFAFALFSFKTKPVAGSLKRKSECDAPNNATESESAPIKDCAPPLSPAPTKDSTPSVEAAFSSPPTLSLPPPLSKAGDKDRIPLPQAVVKPQVLTHLIEGFVIQEGAEPFPVSLKPHKPVLKCEYCGCLAPASQFRGSKRFCSNSCAKRYNVSCTQHFKSSRGRSGARVPPRPMPSGGTTLRRGPSRRSSSSSNYNKISSKHPSVKSTEHSAPPSDSSAPGGLPLGGASFLSATPAQWSVDEVCKFISSLQGCEELAAHFLSQEIDGQALLLLREEHLISTMNIKLGPALKICASINSLRE